MSEQTKIEWATHTFNPWEGCTKVSPGCANCYAEARNHRFGLDNWGRGKPRRRTSEATWRNPVKWNRKADLCKCGTGQKASALHGCSAGRYDVPYRQKMNRPRVFPSLCDWLDDEVPIEWLADFLKLIHDTPNLDWLLLTKRPENWRKRIAAVHLGCTPMTEFSFWLCSWLGSRHPLVGRMPGEPPGNVWPGVSVENQKAADERIAALLNIPAKARFLSVEPLLEGVDLRIGAFNGSDSFGQLEGIHWAIIGGESGPAARACSVDWIHDIVRQCKAAGVPCFVKQLGSNSASPTKFCDGSAVSMCLRHSKGGDPAEWPEDLRVREFPEAMR